MLAEKPPLVRSDCKLIKQYQSEGRCCIDLRMENAISIFDQKTLEFPIFWYYRTAGRFVPCGWSQIKVGLIEASSKYSPTSLSNRCAVLVHYIQRLVQHKFYRVQLVLLLYEVQYVLEVLSKDFGHILLMWLGHVLSSNRVIQT